MKTVWQVYEMIYGKRIHAEIIDVHHNDVNQEVHLGKKLWIHRKGAISARSGEVGIIPGAMGRKSYLTVGLGNDESFCSCSHGAGRVMSRKQAKKEFAQKVVVKELDHQQVILGKRNMNDVGEEAPDAYKDIDFVIDQQRDLLKPVQVLRGKAVIKG